MDSIKDGIIQELEEELVRILSNWFERNTTDAEDKEHKAKLTELMQRADDVLSKWL